jgi:RNA polymerase sigma factor (sigma-70 family)
MRYGSHSNDQDLIAGCRQGDRRAQKALYERYYGKLLGIPMRYTSDREEARSLMNQAFLQIFNSLDHYREEGSFLGWMSTLTFRTTMDHLRFEQRYRERVMLEVKEPQPKAGEVEAKLAAEDIFRFIQQLPDHLRVVFSLYVIDGYKHDEIAHLLGITVSNSKWRLAKARASLQEVLAPFYNQKGRSA